MPSENRFFEDLSRVANGALNALSGIRTETEEIIRERLDHLVATMKLVTREEFETVQAMAAKARDEQEVLLDRIAALEAAMSSLREEAASHAPRKPARRAAVKAAEPAEEGAASRSEDTESSSKP